MLIDLKGETELEVSGFGEPHLHVHGDAGGEGFGSLQMFAASLALCSGAVLEEYARGPLATDVRGLRLLTRWTYGDKPLRVSSMEIEVSWPELAREDQPKVLRAIKTCTIHRTLERPASLTTRFAQVAPAALDSTLATLESTAPPLAREAELPISEATRGGATRAR